MDLKFFGILIIIKIAHARYSFGPKFYTQDGGLSIETAAKAEEQQPPRPQNHKPYMQHHRYQYPIYHIITPYRITTTTTITTTEKPATTTTPMPPKGPAYTTSVEFPSDLLAIAKEKLGIERIDEIPSITELAELLGTTGNEQTINYVRQLTKTDEGIALIKAYMESSDYTDSRGSTVAPVGREVKVEKEKEKIELRENTKSNNDVVKVSEPATNFTAAPNLPSSSYFARITNYLSSFLPTANTTQVAHAPPQTLEPVLKRYASQARLYQVLSANPNFPKLPQQQQPHIPLLMRSPLPYHYPVPIRPQVLNKKNTVAKQDHLKTGAAGTNVHLNTPKKNRVHVQLAKILNIEPKKLETFLHDKPKLAELAEKVSHFPIPQDRAALFNGQLMAAVQKAIEHDEDLKRLLSETLN